MSRVYVCAAALALTTIALPNLVRTAPADPRFGDVRPLFRRDASGVGGTQQPAVPIAPPATGAISGTLLDAATSEPVANGIVTITGGRTSILPVKADEHGTFTLSDLPPGEWAIRASHGGYADGWYGAITPYGGEQLFDLAADEKVNGITIRLWRYATVSGRVLDASGYPVAGAAVTAGHVAIAGGRMVFEGTEVRGRQGRTDSQGVYHLTNIIPGSFAIVLLSSAAAPPTAGSSPSGYPTLFYPDSPSSANATVVDLGAGADRKDIDFHLLPHPSFLVSGGFTGSAWPSQVNLRPADPDRIPNTADIRTTAVNPSGHFSFTGVPSGRYVIETAAFPVAQAPPGTLLMRVAQTATSLQFNSEGVLGAIPLAPLPAGPTLWASVPVSVVDRDLVDLQVAAVPGARFTGSVVFAGVSGQPSAAALAKTPIVALTTDGRELGFIPASGIGADGHFQTIGLPPGPYGIRLFPIAVRNWTLTSIRVGGREMIGEPLELGSTDLSATFTYTDEPGQLSGLVRDVSGLPVGDATIYIFSMNRSQWANTALGSGTARAIRTSRDGHYRATLSPGEYYVAAVEATAQVGWQRLDVLDALTKGAKTCVVQVGQHVGLDLTVPTGR